MREQLDVLLWPISRKDILPATYKRAKATLFRFDKHIYRQTVDTIETITPAYPRTTLSAGLRFGHYLAAVAPAAVVSSDVATAAAMSFT